MSEPKPDDWAVAEPGTAPILGSYEGCTPAEAVSGYLTECGHDADPVSETVVDVDCAPFSHFAVVLAGMRKWRGHFWHVVLVRVGGTMDLPAWLRWRAGAYSLREAAS